MKFIGKSGKTIVEHLQDMLNEPALFAEMTGYQTDAVREAIKTLAEDNNGPVKQPDPITGLVPCEYCIEGYSQKHLYWKNKYEPYTGMESTIDITGSDDGKQHQIEVDLWDDGNAYAAFEIHYCPMCGRKLGGR